jgi:hypothetical protein
MPITTHTDEPSGTTVITATGDLTFAEVHAALEERYRNPDFRPDQNVLWNLQDAALSAISTDEIQQVAGLVRKHWGIAGKPKAALVVGREVDFGLARMYELQMASESPGEIRVFRDLEEAWSWMTAS